MELGSPSTYSDIVKQVMMNSRQGVEARTAFIANRTNTIATNAYPFLLYSSLTKKVFIKKILFRVTGTGLVQVLVNPTITTLGTNALTPFACDNTTGSPAATALLYHTPTTVGADGTEIFNKTVAAGGEEFSYDFEGALRFKSDTVATPRLIIKGATTTLQVIVEYAEGIR